MTYIGEKPNIVEEENYFTTPKPEKELNWFLKLIKRNKHKTKEQKLFISILVCLGIIVEILILGVIGIEVNNSTVINPIHFVDYDLCSLIVYGLFVNIAIAFIVFFVHIAHDIIWDIDT